MWLSRSLRGAAFGETGEGEGGGLRGVVWCGRARIGSVEVLGDMNCGGNIVLYKGRRLMCCFLSL